MRPILRFLLPLVLVLGVLVWTAAAIVDRTSRAWFERDVELRAELAVNGARAALAAHVHRGDRDSVGAVLEAITRDERIMGAAACDDALRPIARTTDAPGAFGCDIVGPRVRLASGDPAQPWIFRAFHQVASLPSGRVHVSGLPLLDEERPLGLVILVHDMRFADRREVATRRFALGAFTVLALAAALVTVLVARFSWRSWTAALRRHLRGEPPRREFQPLLRDVRELVDQLQAETRADGGGGRWTPERLRRILNEELQGEKVIIVANREPYIHQRGLDGTIKILHPASGLVTALEPVMRACSGVWVAHGSGSADRETSDRAGRIRVPPGEESYFIRRLWLTPAEERGYYYGFANEGLWALCHVAHARPVFRGDDFAHYSRVNRIFAAAAWDEADGPDPIVLVQDYHFALAPLLIRERLPRAKVLTFWHIPWPNAERFGICPFGREILRGLLGSSIVGFHTQLHCNNFLDAIDRYLEARIDREQQAVIYQGRTTLVRAYPISIDWPNRWADAAPPVPTCRAEVLDRLGLPDDALLGVGVDRLDYTKGIEERFLAVERLLERFPHLVGRFRFIQIAAPSRTEIERYSELNRSVEALAERINNRFGIGSYRPVLLLREHHEPESVFRFYRAADVCYVSSLHDGMNLVAKEFIAARDDEQGVLVLSEFTGASRELTEALIVNPYDLELASSALAAALSMSPEEQRERMRAMRRLIAEFNVYRWAGRMLSDAARLRKRDRVSDRLIDHLQRSRARPS